MQQQLQILFPTQENSLKCGWSICYIHSYKELVYNCQYPYPRNSEIPFYRINAINSKKEII